MDSNDFLFKKFFYIFVDIDNVFNSLDWVRFTKSALISTTDLFDKTDEERKKYGKYVTKSLTKHPEWQEFYDNKEFIKSKYIRNISPFNVNNFNLLIEKINERFNVNVIFTSSDWRDGFDMKTIPALVKNGFNYKSITIDKTSKATTKCEEILNYMNEIKVINIKSKNYIIIDSNCKDLEKFPPQNLINTSEEFGLTEEIVNEIIKKVL